MSGKNKWWKIIFYCCQNIGSSCDPPSYIPVNQSLPSYCTGPRLWARHQCFFCIAKILLPHPPGTVYGMFCSYNRQDFRISSIRRTDLLAAYWLLSDLDSTATPLFLVPASLSVTFPAASQNVCLKPKIFFKHYWTLNAKDEASNLMQPNNMCFHSYTRNSWHSLADFFFLFFYSVILFLSFFQCSIYIC